MIAIDTNVLVYAVDRADPVKRSKARTLLTHLYRGSIPTILLWQVLTEFARYLRSREDGGTTSRRSTMRYLGIVRRRFSIAAPHPRVLDIALDLSSRYSLSHWDSLILAACVDAGVTTLYTEDMGSPTQYDTVQLLNPFV
jgi:predicted nucleic acid-binding protein